MDDWIVTCPIWLLIVAVLWERARGETYVERRIRKAKEN